MDNFAWNINPFPKKAVPPNSVYTKHLHMYITGYDVHLFLDYTFIDLCWASHQFI